MIRYTEIEAEQLIADLGKKKAFRISIIEVFRSILRVAIKRRTLFSGRKGFSLSLVYISYFIMKLAHVSHLCYFSGEPYDIQKRNILSRWDKHI